MPIVYNSAKNKIEQKEKKRPGILTAFAVRPGETAFENQEEEEEIVLLLRKHWVTNVPWILLFLVMIIAPFFLLPMLAQARILAGIPGKFVFISIIFWYLFSFAVAFEKFLIWYYSVFLVTNERAVDIDFYSLLYKEIAEARLAKIQEVSYKVGGVARALFDYGDVLVQTAGAEPNVEFEAVPKPTEVVKIITEMMEKAKR